MNTTPIVSWIALLGASGALLLTGCDDRKETRPASATASDDGKKVTDPAVAEPEAARTAPAASSQPGAQPGQPGAQPGQPGAQPDASGPTLTLVEPGAEPRRQLRYKLVKGATETMVMVIKNETQTKVPDVPTPDIKVPTIEMTMTMTIGEPVSDTEARYEFVMTGATVRDEPGTMPMTVSMMQQALTSAKGMKGSAIVDSRGFSRDVKIKLPDTLNAEMKQIIEGAMNGMDQMSSPLPTEPIGKGAKWELHQVVEQNGMKIKQLTQFELTELAGDTGMLTAKVKQKADRQDVNLPTMPPGSSAELLKLSSLGASEIKFDLARLVPSSELGLTSDYTINVNSMGQVRTMDVHMEMNVTISGK